MPILRRHLWLIAILALLLLQQLGLGHRYAHAQRWEGADGVAVSTVSVGASASGLESSGGLPAHDSSLCDLLDHLAAGDGHAPPAPLLWAAALLVLAYLSVLAGNFIARRVAPFQARGPPVSL